MRSSFYNQMVTELTKRGDNDFVIKTDMGTEFNAKIVVIAAGRRVVSSRRSRRCRGSMALRAHRCSIRCAGWSSFGGKDILIVGGGDSALDWTLNLEPLANSMTLLHRRDDFRAAPDSVNKMRELVAAGRMDLKIGQVTALNGEGGPAHRWSRPRARTANSTLPATPCCRSSG